MSLLTKLKGEKAENLTPEQLMKIAEEKRKKNLNRPIEELSSEELGEVAKEREMQLKQEELKQRELDMIQELRDEKKDYYKSQMAKFLDHSVDERFLRFLSIADKKFDLVRLIGLGETDVIKDTLKLFGLEVVEPKKLPTAKDFEEYANATEANTTRSGLALFSKFERTQMSREKKDLLKKM